MITLVDLKKAVNLSMPESVLTEFISISKTVGGGDKWPVVTAAIVLFSSLPEDEQREYISKIRGADAGSDMIRQLLDDAKKGILAMEIRDTIERRKKFRDSIKGSQINTADQMNEKKAASNRRGPRGKSSTDSE